MKTAEEKFYERAAELGIKEFATCKFGHYGVETPAGVIILVHEDEKDNFDELRYLNMKGYSEEQSMRNDIFRQYEEVWDEFDDEDLGLLYKWLILGDDYDKHPYPTQIGFSGVYWACTPVKTIRFEDSQLESEYDELYKKVKAAIFEEVWKKKPTSEGFWDISFREVGDFAMLYNSCDDQDSYAELIVSVSFDHKIGDVLICAADGGSFHLSDDDFSLESLLHLLEAIKNA